MGRLILHVDREAFCAAVDPRGHPEWSGVWRWRAMQRLLARMQ